LTASICNHGSEFVCRSGAAARYTLRVERQLKERLIGAAVLIALAVVLVPEMFSGPASRAPAEPVALRASEAAQASTDQLKTWRVDLQSASVGNESSGEPTAAPPAAAPRTELQAEPVPKADASTDIAVNASSISSPTVPTTSHSSAVSVSSVNDNKMPVSKPEQSKPEPVQPSAVPDATGKWQVQVGSFGTSERARQIAAQLKSQGYSASVSGVKVSGRTLYRVRVGGGSNRDVAQATLKKLTGTYPGSSLVAPE
jgi:DedD protein